MQSVSRIEPRPRAVGAARVAWPGVVRGVLVTVLLAGWSSGSLTAQVFVRGSEERDPSSGVYLPTDRALSRAMARAQERLHEHEYHLALTFLHDVLTKDEDTFLEMPGDATQQQGLKATARRLIGELPAEGRAVYELLYASAARRQLKAALDAGDQAAVSRVVRQYCYTPAGYQAALVLAQMEADRGHHLAAAQIYDDLIDTPQAAAQFQPQLSVLAAVNHLAAGQPNTALTRLRALVDSYPSATIELAGRSVRVPPGDNDQLEWLTELIGVPRPLEGDSADWPTHRGDAARNARPTGGAPHLRPRWQARVVNDPTVEATLVDRNNQSLQSGAVDIPMARPIAVRDVVLMRTPYNIVALDWHTGKRVWETREDDEFGDDDLRPRIAVGDDADDPDVSAELLAQRIWDDALVTSLASDGERAFGIRSRVVTPQEEAMGLGVPPGFGGFSVASATANQLLAYDLSTQGKLLWELDGRRTAGPLAGAFFLGAPLALDNTLFVLAEIRSAVYLLALEPQTGQLKWQQQLIELETGIASDAQRRLAGATPSYAGGVLICPTSAGVVVAIDVVKREFAWVYRYQREVPTAADVRQMWQLQQPAHQMTRLANRWRDGDAIVHDGRVFLTPPESGQLHCLDLRSGKQLWTEPRRNALFVGCIDQGLVLLVGRDSVRALRVDDGSSAWGEALKLPTGMFPSGQGYLSGGIYYLPVTTGGVAAIDLLRGRLLPPNTEPQAPELGNLICYRGSVISQSALVIDKFEQRDVLQQRADAALARNPNDATALRELAELKRADGGTSEAVQLLKRAVELAPADPVTQEMLAEVLLQALADDFAAYRHDVPLARRLSHDRQQEIELLQIEALGLDKLGERLPAFRAYLQLTDFTAGSPTDLQISPDYSVRSDCWVRGRLGRLWSAATPDEQQAITSEMASRRPAVDAPSSVDQLRHYLAHFAELPGADEVRLRLARWLVDHRHAREAEFVLLELATSPSDQSRAAAAVLMTRLLIDSGSLADVGPFASQLAGPWKNVTALDGKTGRQWLDELIREAPAILDAPADTWPRGHVDAQVNLIPESAAERVDRRNTADRQGGLRRLIFEQDAWPLHSAAQWFVASDGSSLVGRDGLGNDFFQLPVEGSSWARQFGDVGYVRAARLGHVLIVSLGGQVVAVDSRPGDRGTHGDVLWQAQPTGRYTPAVARSAAGRTARRSTVYDTYSSRKRLAGAASSLAGAIGPVSPQGVVVQMRNELRCVDPISGETLWFRSDVSPGCELFGDGQLVFAADPQTREARVYSLTDGRLVGRRNLPGFPWMLTAGRNVAQREIRGTGQDRHLYLRLTDADTLEVLFEAQYDDQAQMAVVEPQCIAIFDPSGTFQLVDVAAARLTIDQQLQPVDDVQEIRTLESDGTLFLAISTPSLQKEISSLAPVDYPLVHGLVYAFDRESGTPLWPGPAVVRNRGLVLGQPRGLPWLVFADRKSARAAGSPAGANVRLLCVDKLTGRTVYRNDRLRDTPPNRFGIRGEHGDKPQVTIEMSTTEVVLAMSHRPRPPQPPASDDLELPRSTAERGLLGVGRRMAGALQDALEKRADPNRPALQPVPPNERAADDAKPQPLDDD